MNILNSEEDVIKTDILKARGNTLVFYNTIYQISSIAEIKMINLSTEKNMPQLYWLFLFLAVVLAALSEHITILPGVASLGLFVYLVYQHNKNKLSEKYGLYISLNSGRSTVITSRDQGFLKKVSITLHNIMNKEEASVNFDFSSNTINEVKASEGSVIVTGEVSGDIATNI